MLILIVVAIVVVCSIVFALALARAAAIGDDAAEFKRKAAKRHWWDW